MASALAGLDVLRVRTYCRLGEQNAIGVYHAVIDVASFVGTVTLEQFASSVSSDLGGRLKNMMCTAAEYRGLSAERLSNVATQPVFSITAAGPGTSTGDPLPPQTAGMLNLRTVEAGRKGIGRKFVPFPAESINTSEGKPVAGYVDALNDLGTYLSTVQTVLVDGSNHCNFHWIILHRETFTYGIINQGLGRFAWSQMKRRSFLRRADALPPV